MTEPQKTEPNPAESVAPNLAADVQAPVDASAGAAEASPDLTNASATSTASAEPLLADAQKRIAELEAQNTVLSDQWVRAQAEMQNTRRISAEEVSKARKYAVESFAENLLPVIDSLEAGLAIKDATPEQIREGAQATLRQFHSALERSKVLPINPAVAAKFDPAQHQAISMVPADQPTNSIVSVLQKGYTIAERVLRPALVTVAAPPK